MRKLEYEFLEFLTEFNNRDVQERYFDFYRVQNTFFITNKLNCALELSKFWLQNVELNVDF